MIKLHFYKPHGIIGHLICWLTRKRYCHVAIEHQVYGVPVITQADPIRGISCWRPSLTHAPDATVAINGISDEWAGAWLAKMWGQEYGYLDIALFKLKGHFGIPARDNMTGVICSELVTMFLLAADEANPLPQAYRIMIAKLNRYRDDPASISPGQLADIILG